MRTSLLALMLAAAAARADAATYYVATTGSDSASGTSTAPLKTIAAGVAKAKAGDTIIVRDGTYAYSGSQGGMAVTINKAGTSSAWITLQAEHKGKAILDCKLICHSYIAFGGSSAYWKIIGFSIRGGHDAAIFSNSGGGKNVLIQDNEIHHIGNRSNSTPYGEMGIYTDASAIFTIDRNVFHDIGRTDNITGNHDHGIYTHGTMTITNNVFYTMTNGWHIQTAAGFGGTIANNTFYGPATGGKPGQVKLWGAAKSMTIRNNIFYNTRSVGISVLSVTSSGGCSIDHNIVYTPGASVAMIESLPSGCTQSSNKLNVDPKLVNPTAGGDYHLNAGSPAIDAGAAVSGVTTDLAGAKRPAGAALDVGAYEYGSSGGVISPATSTPPPTTTPTTTPTGCTTASAGFKNVAFASQSKAFTLQFDASPDTAGMDGLVGPSKGAAASYGPIAAAVRFNTAGYIDALNGGAYSAQAAIPYVAKASYHFRLLVDLPNHRYTAYVKLGSANEQLIGANYGFRTGQTAATSLDNLVLVTSKGGVTVCSPAVSASVVDTTPPSITGLSATGTTQSGATVIWTTGEPADGAVEYGPTTAYGATTPLSTALATSHSVAISGLAAGTLYHYRARSKDAAGNLALSPDSTFTTLTAAVPATGAGCATAALGWKSLAFGSQTKTFAVEFDATPDAAKMDGTIGLSKGAATSYGLLAAIIRFNTAGYIDARNGAAYAALLAVPYAAKTTYHFRFVVDMAAKKYSVYVKSGASAEQQLASNYAFRSEMAGATSLDTVTLATSSGSETVCKVTSAATTTATATTTPTTTTTAPSCVAVGAAWKNIAIAAKTASFSLEFDATPTQAGTDGVMGLSNGPATDYPALAAAVRFNTTGKIDARNGGAFAALASIPYTPGTPYHFRLAVNPAGHTYSAYVRQGTQTEQAIGLNYAFRTEQATVSSLSNVGANASIGGVSLCGVVAR